MEAVEVVEEVVVVVVGVVRATRFYLRSHAYPVSNRSNIVSLSVLTRAVCLLLTGLLSNTDTHLYLSFSNMFKAGGFFASLTSGNPLAALKSELVDTNKVLLVIDDQHTNWLVQHAGVLTCFFLEFNAS